jgi:hypothetical protein
MSPKFINAKYYNLVNNIVLNPNNIKKYFNFNEIKGHFINVENTENITFNLSPLLASTRFGGGGEFDYQQIVYNKNKEAIYKLFNNISMRKMANWILMYFDSLHNRYSYNKHKNKIILITWEEYLLLTKIMTKNTYKIRDMLIRAISYAYFTEYIAPPIIKAIAISKIKRNAIYNKGLGLKLAIKAYSKDF